MRRFLAAAGAAVLLSLSALPASAETQPTAGYASTDRNPEGFGGGPHCHVLTAAGEQAPFDFVAVFPSHTGHAHAGGDVFTADPNCNGVPGGA
jgi:hypothetical protein